MSVIHNEASIPRIKLLDGKSIPHLSWGNGTGDAKKTAIESGHSALKAGIRHIDTAQGYDNEEETGTSIKQSGLPKGDIWVTSKLSQEGGATDKTPIPTAAVRAAVNLTISPLGFQPDLLLVHNPFVPEAGQIVPFWQELEKMKDDGTLTSSIGVSNFRPQDLEELLKVAVYKPVVNQLEYHPFVLTHLEPVLKIQEEHGIITEAYGPLSPILRHSTGGGPLKPILQKIAHRVSSATGREVDSAAVLLLWTRAKNVVAVTASGNEERIQKLSDVQSLPDLLPEEVEEIEKVGRAYHFRAYDEHMCVDFPVPEGVEQTK